jgi:hypothetical protein
VELVPDPLQDEFVSTIAIRFHNGGPGSAYIMKPLDGSFDGRGEYCMPSYRLRIQDPDGQLLNRAKRDCNEWGKWAGTKWPDDYLVEIKEGHTCDSKVTLTDFEVIQTGLHTVSFEYVYQQPRDGRYLPPPEAWRGFFKAPDIVVMLKASK